MKCMEDMMKQLIEDRRKWEEEFEMDKLQMARRYADTDGCVNKTCE